MNGIGNIEQQLRDEGVYVSTTVGYSMWPMLRNRRDRIIVIAKGDQRLKKWDLPLYRYPDGRYVLHRIIAVKDGKIAEMGTHLDLMQARGYYHTLYTKQFERESVDAVK